MVVVSGPHRLAPVELHDGRPILYGLGNFIWSDMTERLQGYFYRHSREMVGGLRKRGTATDADLTSALNAETFDDPEIFRAVLATIGFEAGAVSRIRLHPLELGYGQPLTRSGVPRAASPEGGREILEHVRAISEPFGTAMALEDGVAVIRP